MPIARWCVLLINLTACRPEAAPSVAAAPTGLAPPTALPTIHYRVVPAPSKEPDVESFTVVAERGGETFEVSAAPGDSCLSVWAERDLDGDGLRDALLEYGICGNCCPPTYFFVAGTTTNRFEAQELAADWGTPNVEKWRGRTSLVIVSETRGYNTFRPEMVTRRFIFERGRAIVAEEVHAVEVKALVNLRAEQFVQMDTEEEHSVSFDLDRDGRADELVGRLWPRWGLIQWRVEFADGRSTEEWHPGCKRLGVLPEKTLGHHDLVCDFDTRFRWDGQAYRTEAAP